MFLSNLFYCYCPFAKYILCTETWCCTFQKVMIRTVQIVVHEEKCQNQISLALVLCRFSPLGIAVGGREERKALPTEIATSSERSLKFQSPYVNLILCVQEVVTHFIQLAYYINWVTTSWTYCICYFMKKCPVLTHDSNLKFIRSYLLIKS